MGVLLRPPDSAAVSMTTESSASPQSRSHAAGAVSVAERSRMDVDDTPPSPSAQSRGGGGSVPFFRKMLPRWNVGSGWQYLSTTPSEKLLLVPPLPPPATRSPDGGSGTTGGIVSRPAALAPPNSAATPTPSSEPLPAWERPSGGGGTPSPSHKDEWLQALRGFFARSQPSRQAIGRRSPVAQLRDRCGSGVDVELIAQPPYRRDQSVPRQHSADVERRRGPSPGGSSTPDAWGRSASCEQPGRDVGSSRVLYHAAPCHAVDVAPTPPWSPEVSGTMSNAAAVQRRPSPRYARLQSDDHRRSDAAAAPAAAVAAACRRNSSRRATVDCAVPPRPRPASHAVVPGVPSLPDFGRMTGGGSSGGGRRLIASEASSSVGSVFTATTTTTDDDDNGNTSESDGGSAAGDAGCTERDPDLGFYGEWSASLRRFAALRRSLHQLDPPKLPSAHGQAAPSAAAAVSSSLASAAIAVTSGPIQASRRPEVSSSLLLLLPSEPTGSAAGAAAAAAGAARVVQPRSNSYCPTLEPPPEPRPRAGSAGQGQQQQHRSRTPRLFRRGLQMLTERARNSFRSSSRRNSEKQEMSRKMKTAHSYESLLAGGPTVQSSDVREGRAQIQPLHASILGQENCFQIVTNSGSTFYACRGAEERDRWIACLRKTINPHEDSSRRVDVSLKLWVQEAKNCQTKKRYFCEISLDKTVYARTSTKVKGDMLFWGEQFEFENLPAVSAVTLTLFKESSDKRTRLRQVWAGSGAGGERGAVAIGCVTIAVSELLNRQVSEQWYTVGQLPASSSVSTTSRSSRDSKTNSGSGSATSSAAAGDGLPQIRVKARYQAVQVLPLTLYSDLSQYVQHNYLGLVAELEPLLPVRAKDDIATVLVNILHHEGKATAFLCDIVMADVLKQENSHVVFRGNTIATKAIEAYMKLVSGRYLRLTLGECVRTVLEGGDDCEVDPSKLHGGTGGGGGTVSQSLLARHQASLVKYCEQVWAKIVGSLAQFPSELRDVFAAFRGCCRDLGKADLANNLISSCVFLRLLCPAIMSPSLFGLCQEFPDERASRTLTLVAKTIQSLANFTKFGGKEDYMLHMNEFVDREWARMHEYLQKISSIDSKYRRVDYEGRVDVAKHLSLLHSLLVEEAKAPAASAGDADQSAGGSPSEMRRLQPVLQRLTDEVLHGGSGEGGSSAPPPAGSSSTSAVATDCGGRSHGQEQAVAARVVDRQPARRSRPLSAGDHAAILVVKDGCAPLPAAGEVRVLVAAAATTKPRDGTSTEPTQRTGTRQAVVPPSQPQQAAGERHALTEPRVRSARRPTGAADVGGGGSSSGGSSNPVERVRQQPVALSPGGGCKHELASDSAYDTLRSTGSQSDGGGWAQGDAPSGGASGGGGGGGGDGSSSRLNDSLCGASSSGTSSSGSSLASTKKMVLHKVWDRVLTANDLITGDYVDLISYVDDARRSPSDGGGSDKGTLTTTSSTAAALSLLGSGHHAAVSREGSAASDAGTSYASLGSGGDTLSKKGAGSAAAPTTPVRQAPLTFFNPAFRAGAGTSHVPTVPEPSGALPYSRSYPGHVGIEPVDASGSGTAVPPRQAHWHTPDRFGSLRSKQDTSAVGPMTLPVAAAVPQAHKTPLALHASLGATPTAATATTPSVPLGQVPVPMARRTVSNGGVGNSPSGCDGFGRAEAGMVSAATPREQPPGAELYAVVNGRAAAPARLAAGSTAADMHATPVDGGVSRRDVLPGESSTWSRGTSSGHGAYRDERLPGCVGSTTHHQSHFDVHTSRGGAHTGPAAPASVDGSRTLPVPKRGGAADSAAERESVEFLKQQVEEAQRRLADTEQRLAQQAEQTDRTIQEWRQRLEASEESLRMQARVKDEQIEGIVQRLMAIEDELRREQRELKDALSQRQRLVERQEKKIRLLDETNSDLVGSLQALREHGTRQGPSPPPPAPSDERQPSPRPDDSADEGRPLPAAAAAAASAAGRLFKTTLYYSQAGGGGLGS